MLSDTRRLTQLRVIPDTTPPQPALEVARECPPMWRSGIHMSLWAGARRGTMWTRHDAFIGEGEHAAYGQPQSTS